MREMVKWFGSKSKMAAALGVTRSAVSQWLVDGVPPARAIQIEEVTGGKFKAVDICGDNNE